MFAKVVSLLALFVALGGSAYAAVTITGRNVKNGSLTSADIRNRSLLSKDFKPGQLAAGPRGAQGAPGATGAKGPPGVAGRAATTAFAYVREPFPAANQPAAILYGRGVSAVADPDGNNDYTLTFARSLAGCVVEAMPGAGNPSDTNVFFPDAVAAIDLDPVHMNMASVKFEAGKPQVDVDTSFMVEAFC
jgi:hypothetical protein